VFNSDKGSVDKYDFGMDHGPGNDDHSDGKIYRYVSAQLAGADDVSSHVFFNQSDKHLYIADTGNKRIVKLDTLSGTMGSTFSGQEPVIERRRVNDAVLTDVVPPGLLEAPSGIEIHNDLIYVTDNATSRFHAFDLTGKLVRTLDTGLPPGSLNGLMFGPDNKVYFTDFLSSRVYRIDPK
jgi:sugar lactone lactonase YvrE